ncbi:class F sortase [Streptomyces sp. TR02-1]|uniref:class F sortase n=1 Tax=Streptomyces sp. TR02-1 TaxID=3385977 RepID=UPI0039A1295A
MDDDRRFPFRLPLPHGWMPEPGVRNRALLGGAAFALVLGLALIRAGTEGRSGPPQPATAPAAATAPDRTDRTGRPTPPSPGAVPLPRAHPPLAPSRPGRVSVPSVGIDAALVTVGLGPDGQLGVPPAARSHRAGWYGGAVTPGERGTAVLVGHVDDASGPAVFFRLGAVRPGAEVAVVRADGRRAVFTVYAVESHRKDAFPGERVYRDTPRAELRMLTCGGGYTEDTGYQANVVVFARLTDVR